MRGRGTVAENARLLWLWGAQEEAAVEAVEAVEAEAEVSPLIAALLEKTAANKELNDKKRLATSYANFARSRTVTGK